MKNYNSLYEAACACLENADAILEYRLTLKNYVLVEAMDAEGIDYDYEPYTGQVVVR